MQLTTKRGYVLGEVASALQKAVRRGDARLAGYWAVEMFESGYQEYAWRRLLTISAEDCWGILTHEVEALYNAWITIAAAKKKQAGEHPPGRIFLAKAVILLALAKKSRDADHLTNYVYDRQAGLSDEALLRDLAAAREAVEPVPAYAFDCHTKKGRSAGKTKDEFFREEFEALSPREPGLFDDVLTQRHE